jgi:hypothetical protein
MRIYLFPTKAHPDDHTTFSEHKETDRSEEKVSDHIHTGRTTNYADIIAIGLCNAFIT